MLLVASTMERHTWWMTTAFGGSLDGRTTYAWSSARISQSLPNKTDLPINSRHTISCTQCHITSVQTFALGGQGSCGRTDGYLVAQVDLLPSTLLADVARCGSSCVA